ncbi:hypothetical protein SAMN04488515_0784 [Cognatiyoonia koreensis]|uniref:Uncharacterized protein n=1 Tax=Cognatiyoonia koreensis TaxID=364200 RepID=A0A1I0NRZ0_9RHOB|nr:hypothetical protein [Cognatiyoonia koreensis]SEW04252.1 hypothetical protein SAMN04488515_0784 [Cognatiyoonia koreensis]
MNDKIVELKRPEYVQPPVTDFWFAQVDNRLGRIELMVNRLEWQILLIVCACAAVFVLELLAVLKG